MNANVMNRTERSTWVVVLGALGLVQPDRFRALFSTMESRSRYVFAIVTRLALGAFLWFVADELRYPQVMRVLAVIAVVAAVAILIIGRQRLDRMIDWWLSRPDSVLRVSAIFATAFGAFLIYVAY